MRVLVCGGRDYDPLKTEAWLEGFDMYGPTIRTIIEGGASGADSGAKNFAVNASKKLETYPADWKTHGRRAGYLRNMQMLEEGKPDLVVAFPGGKGTAMMVNLAKAKGVPVIEVNSTERRSERTDT